MLSRDLKVYAPSHEFGIVLRRSLGWRRPWIIGQWLPTLRCSWENFIMAGDDVVAQLAELVSPAWLAEDVDAGLMEALERLEALVMSRGSRELSDRFDAFVDRVYRNIDQHDRQVMYELFDPSPDCAERLLEDLRRKPAPYA